MTDILPIEVTNLKSIGEEAIGALKQLSHNVSVAHSSSTPSSEDPAVLSTLNIVMDKLKLFKSRVESVRQANSGYLKARQDPSASIQISFNELLGKIQSELEKLELENATIRSKLHTLDACSSINLDAIIDSSKRLALTTHAPAGWNPGASLWPYRPPYPTEDLIRSTELFLKMTGDTVEAIENPDIPSKYAKNPDTTKPAPATFPTHPEDNEDAELLKGLDIASL